MIVTVTTTNRTMMMMMGITVAEAIKPIVAATIIKKMLFKFSSII